MKLNCKIKNRQPKIYGERWFLNKLINGANTIATKRPLYQYAGRSIFVSMDSVGYDNSMIIVTRNNKYIYHKVIDSCGCINE